MVKGRSRNRAYSARRDLAQDGAFDVCGLKRPVLHDVWSFSRILHTLQTLLGAWRNGIGTFPWSPHTRFQIGSLLDRLE